MSRIVTIKYIYWLNTNKIPHKNSTQPEKWGTNQKYNVMRAGCYLAWENEFDCHEVWGERVWCPNLLCNEK